ncbi:MAG: TatD family nuclease-associated radical SAM protein [Methanoregula sp.]
MTKAVVYESNNNLYINIAKTCTSDCIFCTKEYFNPHFFETKNENLKKSQNLPEKTTEQIISDLEGLVLTQYNKNLFVGDGEERVRCLDEVKFGIVRPSKQILYGYDLYLEKEPSFERVKNDFKKYVKNDYYEAVFTGMGEPLTRLDLVIKITKWLDKQNFLVRLDTNGHAKYLFPKRNVVKELLESGMKTISISLNAHDEITYNQLCRPHFNHAYSQMLEFAREVSQSGMNLRFTIVDIPIIDKEKCRQIALDYNADFVIRKFT